VLIGCVDRKWMPAPLRLAALLAGWLFLSAVWFVPSVQAHAELEKATPVQDARLDRSPPAVELVFNERLDPAGARLEVLDERSRQVAGGKPERIQGGTGLKLALPALGEGHYTVSYSVISADGHPVSGAYVFTVGNPPPATDAASLDPHVQVGHEHHHGSAGGGLTLQDFLFYASRVAYYAGWLAMAGLMLWSLWRKAPAGLREVREKWIGAGSKYALLATIFYVFFQLSSLGEGEPLSEWGRIATSTTVGRLYIAELLLAAASLLLARLGAGWRIAWAALALLAEAWSGHAAAYAPVGYTVALDFVHLAAASLWCGGLLLLLLLWRSDRQEAGRFALAFSRWALASFLVLWATGIVATLRFLPAPNYLLYTSWGKWLIAKAALTVLVAVLALLIRRRLRRGRLPQGALLRADAGLMAAIVLCVGVLTYQNPLPANEPLYYHQMGTDMHLTLRISPRAPGTNTFIVKVWLPEQTGRPKKVELRLQPTGRPEFGWIEVPIAPYQDPEPDAFTGYVKATYQAEGPYLPFPGKWEAQVRVTDGQDNEIVRTTSFRLY